MSFKNKLNRMKPHLTKETVHSGTAVEKMKENSIKENEPIPYQLEWEKENVTPFYFDDTYCLIREVTYPLDYQYGKYRFSELIDAVQAWNNSTFIHPLSSRGFSAEDLFFFDTETTGLGGGVGNTIFLLGHARIAGEKLIVKQHILPNPGAEIPLYQSFLDEVDYTTLVTYNGKAFDWPQVKTRHTLIKEHVPRLPSFGHFDLFHAARRLWKHKLERLKLSIVEKEVLDITRTDDVPGFLAPMIYFDFVDRKNPEGMLGILKHNEMDILSLITLYTHLTFQLLMVDQQQTVKEKFEVGRWYSYLGDSTAALETLSSISDQKEYEGLKAKHVLAYEYKKQKNFDKAKDLWLDIVCSGTNPITFEACIELAKIFEHRVKDLNQAHIFCMKAFKLIEGEQKQGDMKNRQCIEQVMKRLDRLERKLSKQFV